AIIHAPQQSARQTPAHPGADSRETRHGVQAVTPGQKAPNREQAHQGASGLSCCNSDSSCRLKAENSRSCSAS
ncbi:hypothetical protein, partial [Escherichia coli]|uniref:hypothetical protein n=1 Tax=Escherichia coli TaxID=562 RepID=UPI0019683435